MKYNFNEEFFSLPFYVDKRVLIPRNDTEILVERVLKEIIPPPTGTPFGKGRDINEYILIDVGTGSSAILTAILKNSKIHFRKAFGVDISNDALEVAKINIEQHGLQDKVILEKSDLLEVFLNKKHKINSKNIIITANLPYIKNGDFENMDKEVLDNEPHIALFGGEKTGFEIYEKLISQIIELKNIYILKKMILFIEIGFDQYEYSGQFLSSLGLKFEYFKDLNNIHRVIKINF